jgi:hypothetical protein
VPGVASANDEDLLHYKPDTNTWSLYFDGSDVGLNPGNSDENIDGVSVTEDGNIYLTTAGNFNVGSLSGADEDVFICVTPSITEGTNAGNTITACSSFSLYFAGNPTLGIDGDDGRDIDEITVSGGGN